MMTAVSSAHAARFDVPVALGDSIERVQSALGTEVKPEPFTSVATTGGTAIRLRTRGIWVFFDKEGKAQTIRLDAPFAGELKGVKIGSSYASIVEKLGQPAKTLKVGVAIPGRLEPVIYYLSDAEGIRMDFDRDGLLETVYIVK
jgi:hypothetical protein